MKINHIFISLICIFSVINCAASNGDTLTRRHNINLTAGLVKHQGLDIKQDYPSYLRSSTSSSYHLSLGYSYKLNPKLWIESSLGITGFPKNISYNIPLTTSVQEVGSPVFKANFTYESGHLTIGRLGIGKNWQIGHSSLHLWTAAGINLTTFYAGGSLRIFQPDTSGEPINIFLLKTSNQYKVSSGIYGKAGVRLLNSKKHGNLILYAHTQFNPEVIETGLFAFMIEGNTTSGTVSQRIFFWGVNMEYQFNWGK